MLPLIHHCCGLVDVFVTEAGGADALLEVADHVAVAAESAGAAVAFDVAREVGDAVLEVHIVDEECRGK